MENGKHPDQNMIGTLNLFPSKVNLHDQNLIKKDALVKFYIGDKSISTDISRADQPDHPSWKEGVSFLRTDEEEIRIELVVNEPSGQSVVLGGGTITFSGIINGGKVMPVELSGQNGKIGDLELTTEFHTDYRALKYQKHEVEEAVENAKKTNSPLQLQKKPSNEEPVDLSAH